MNLAAVFLGFAALLHGNDAWRWPWSCDDTPHLVAAVIPMIGPFDTSDLNATFRRALQQITVHNCENIEDVVAHLSAQPSVGDGVIPHSPYLLRGGKLTMVLDSKSDPYDVLSKELKPGTFSIDNALYFKFSTHQRRDQMKIHMQVIIELPPNIDARRIYNVTIEPEDTPAKLMARIEKATRREIFYGRRVSLSVRHVDWSAKCRAALITYANPRCDDSTKIFEPLVASFLRASESFVLVRGANTVLSTKSKRVLWMDSTVD